MKKKTNEYLFSQLDACITKDHANIGGIVIRQKDKLIFERYYHGYHAETPFHIASVTKSILSLLYGIALDQGFLKSLDTRVLDYFPDHHIKRGEKTIQQITIRHLLTMSAPYKCKSEPYTKMFSSEDWLQVALDLLGGKGSIGEFRYSAIAGTHILSGILVKATGMSVRTFADKYLFSILDIHVEEDIVLHNKEEHLHYLTHEHRSGWVMDPHGIHTAGRGLNLNAVDMAKIGQLCLQGGLWKDIRVVSETWMQESTKEHNRWGALPYGYLWWLLKEQPPGYFAMGDGGNMICCLPEQDAVIAIAADFQKRPGDRLELLYHHILPLLEDN